MSLDKSSGGGDQHPDKAPGPERRPFPGAPEDRPVPSKPVAYRSFEEIAADRAARAAGEGASGQAGHGAGSDAAGPGKGPVGAGPGTADAGPRGSAAAPGSRERTGAVPGNVPARGEDTRPVPRAPGGQDAGRPGIPGGRRPDGPAETDRFRLRPFPGAPEDRPVPSRPVAWRSFDEIRADRAARAGDKRTADHGSVRAAERAAPGQPDAKDAPAAGRDAGPREQDRSSRDQGQSAAQDRENSAPTDRANVAQSARRDPGSDRLPGPDAQLDKTSLVGHDGPGTQDGPRPPDSGDPPAPGTPGHGKGGILHGHSEFHGQKLDLYSDGTRWVGGDAVRAAQEEAAKKRADGQPEPVRHGIADVPQMRDLGHNAVGEKETRSPGDTSDLPPTGEELVETADRGKSRLERLKNEAFQEFKDVLDATKDETQTILDVMSRPAPAGHAEVPVRDGPVAAPAEGQHPTPSPDAVVQMAFVGGVIAIQAGHWAGHKVHELMRRQDADHG